MIVFVTVKTSRKGIRVVLSQFVIVINNVMTVYKFKTIEWNNNNNVRRIRLYVWHTRVLPNNPVKIVRPRCEVEPSSEE